MELTILDRRFNAIYQVDTFESVVWTERYIGYGEFELYMPLDSTILSYAQLNNYVHIVDSDRLMIIETVQIESTFEDGQKVKITGRSLESILDRRIIWNQTIVKGDVQSVIKKLINENVINPTISSRRIANFLFIDNEEYEATNDTDATIDENEEEEDPEVSAQYTGDNLYEVILDICNAYSTGFKIVLNEAHQFEFSIYKGTDRTYDANPYGRFVTFSPSYNNLTSSNYLDSLANYRNVTLVAGEDPEEGSDSSQEGYDRVRVTIGEASDLDRRELYTDARDIRSKLDDGTEILARPYRNMLRQRGYEKLAECQESIAFEGEIDTLHTYVYNKDYFVGDVVKIQNELGIGAKIRITEIVRSQDKEGYKIYPTFEVL